MMWISWINLPQESQETRGLDSSWCSSKQTEQRQSSLIAFSGGERGDHKVVESAPIESSSSKVNSWTHIHNTGYDIIMDMDNEANLIIRHRWIAFLHCVCCLWRAFCHLRIHHRDRLGWRHVRCNVLTSYALAQTNLCLTFLNTTDSVCRNRRW